MGLVWMCCIFESQILVSFFPYDFIKKNNKINKKNKIYYYTIHIFSNVDVKNKAPGVLSSQLDLAPLHGNRSSAFVYCHLILFFHGFGSESAKTV